MREKPLILVFNKYYLPGFKAGGPIRTLANMVEHLSDEFDFRILTLDRDAGDRQPYAQVEQGIWNSVGKAEVMYLSPDNISIHQLVKLILEVSPDAIYLNSFFDSTFTQRVLWARRFGRLGNIPLILAPRGEFSEGALDLKRGKKQVYLLLSSLLGLYRNLTWQASSAHERNDIVKSLKFLKQENIKEVINLAPKNSIGPVTISSGRSGQALRVCFLSRISPKKNLDFALSVLREVSSGITFTIYGPKELASYWERCEALIEDLPDNINVVYAGEVHPSNVNAELSQHDLFFFPTRGENYGHVIHEALLAGLPVLISDQTPWKDLEEHDVGWSFSLSDMLVFAKKIDEVANMEPASLLRMRRKAVSFSVNKAEDAKSVSDNIELFRTAASQGSA
ncbi:glycosyltransferase family 4 protein [Halomonas sp. JS92-SW72]|uniref:glycosyltransferase family 4 protein n=1 Tax=Halomonas sp. JS92-SW72 TaxID=2306583 RepID=UPI000E5BDBA5|nr:glycosyltransferase family 4 protein [Halomonas sp. JS92-SW72]AXY43695.1 glycosyltransferase [Halomonas sp. JS92-SW72]